MVRIMFSTLKLSKFRKKNFLKSRILLCGLLMLIAFPVVTLSQRNLREMAKVDSIFVVTPKDSKFFVDFGSNFHKLLLEELSRRFVPLSTGLEGSSGVLETTFYVVQTDGGTRVRLRQTRLSMYIKVTFVRGGLECVHYFTY